MASPGQIFEVVAPVLATAGAGYAWHKLKRPFDTRTVTPLVSDLAFPLLIIAKLAASPVQMADFFTMVLAAALATICFGVLGYLAVRLLRLDIRAHLGPIMFGNVGNMGLPLCLLAFGDQGLALGIGFVTVNMVGLFTVAAWLSMGRVTGRLLLTSPPLYGAALGIGLILGRVELPDVVATTFSLIGGMAIPLMLLALGVSLASIKRSGLGRSLVASLANFAISGVTAVGLTQIMGLEGAVRGVFIIQCMMPAAVFNYLLAEKYGHGAEEVAGVVFVSTLLSIAALPPILALIL